jgi:imidazolonepropionase-like amidohydrolase
VRSGPQEIRHDLAGEDLSLAEMARRALLALFALTTLLGAHTVYVRAGRVFDGQQLVDGRVIVIRDSLIQAVLPQDASIPDSAEQIDARDCTVLPGLIDSHLHFMADPLPWLDRIEQHNWGKLEAEWMSEFPNARLALLENGVTSVIDLGATPGSYLVLRAALRKGSILGPDVYCSGPLFVPFSGPGPLPASLADYAGRHDLIDNATFPVTDPALARRKVVALAAQGIDFIGIVYDQPGLSLDVARAVIEEAHQHGLRVFASVSSQPEALAMDSSGVDGIELGLPLPRERLLKYKKARMTLFTPAISALAHSAPAQLAQMRQTLKDIYMLGVPLCIGSDYPASYGAQPGDDIFREMDMFEELGIPRSEVLKAATRNAALKLGKGQELGMIAPGYRANLVFMAGSISTGPLNRERIARVMLHGETVIENGRLVPRYAPRFKENAVSVFGLPYWDPLLSYLVGSNVTDYDLFHTGVISSVDLVVSIRNMWLTNVNLFLPSPIPKTALKVGAHFDNQNRLFYGIGNDSRLSDTTEYSNLIFKENLSATTRITQVWKANATFFFDQSKLSPYRYGSLPAGVPGDSGGDEAIASLTLIHDTRDNINNPWYGHYLALTGQMAPAILPGGHRFQKVMFDARGFLSLLHKHVLAGRFLCEQAFGDAPFYYLPDFGGDTLGRGYMPNRLRARIGVLAQLEYRFPIVGPFSGVVFTDVGQFQNSFSAFTTTGFHPTVGFGPRFSTGSNETSIIGVDAGFTREGWNLVLHGGHAF